MRVSRLELANFRNFYHAVIPFSGARTLLIGPNGSGKSTVKDAISLALLGRCRGVDARGAGQKALVRHGADLAIIQLAVEPIGTIVRDLHRKDSATTSHKPDAILGRLNVSDTMMAAMLESRSFFDLGHEDGKRTLLRLLDVRIQPSLLPGCGLSAPADLDTLEALYQRAYSERPALKKALAAIQVPDLPQVVPLNARGLEKTRADLTAIRQRVTDATRQVGKAEGRRDTLARATGPTNSIESLQTRVDTHRSMLGDAERALATATAALDAFRKPAGPDQQELASVRALVMKLKTHEPTRGCVLDQGIPCLTAAAEFTGQVERLTARVAEMDQQVADLAQATQREADLRAAVRAAQRDVDYHTGQAAQNVGLIEATQQQQAEFEAAQRELSTLRPQIAEQQQALADLERQRDELETQVHEAEAYARAVEAREDAERRRATAQQAVEDIEAKVALLGPKGIRLTALRDAVAPFEVMINAALKVFQFELRFSVDPWGVTVIDHRLESHGETPWELLSGGEQIWTGACFQLALAAATGVDFVFIDATDMVVGEARRLLTGVVMQAPIAQIVVAMAKGEHDPVPDMPGLQVIKVAELAAVPV